MTEAWKQESSYGAYPWSVLAAVALLIGVGNRAKVRVGKAARALLVWIATPLKAAAARNIQILESKIGEFLSFVSYHLLAIARKLLNDLKNDKVY